MGWGRMLGGGNEEGREKRELWMEEGMRDFVG
jgi:hypothetical protein